MMKKTLALVCAGMMSAAPMVASAYEAGDMILRFGAATVDADNSGKPQGVYAGNDTQLGINFTYMMTDNVGLEVLAATPFEHDVFVQSGPGEADKEGSTKHLPPSVTVQYYFNNPSSAFTPYVGAGINYTIFFDEKLNDGTEFELDNSFGFVVEAGVDYAIDENWGVNAAIWKMDIDTEIDFKGAPVDGVDVDIDPLVYMVSATYKF